MPKKGLGFIIAILLFSALLLANGVVGLGAPQPAGPAPTPFGPLPTFPAATKVPYYTAKPTDPIVNISDAKLKAALHTATGIAANTAIRQSDLAKLTGGLDLTDKGIVKVDGLQYCENITDLKLTGNKLADLPSSLSKLVNLQTLMLDGNKLTKVPDVLYSMPKLATLSLADNSIKTIPDKINTLAAVTYLDLGGNDIENVPVNLGKCTKLKFLSLAKNKLSKAPPRELFLLPVLERLDLSGNVLRELPKEAAAMPKLVALNVEGNILETLPAGLGNAPSLQQVYASRNRLMIIEPSLLNGKITNLGLDVNRLTELPQGLSGKTFDSFNIEWNYIDMSEGSEARKIADSVIAPNGKAFERQLKAIPAVQAQPSLNTVFFQWEPMQDGSSGDSSWKVSKYQIYLVNGDSWGNPVAELDRLASHYVATKLNDDKDYKFQIGVEYSLTLNGLKTSTRYFTPVEVKTLSDTATVAPTIEPTETPAPVETLAAEPTGTAPVEEEPVTPASSGNTTLLIVLVVAGGVLLIGVILFFMIRTARPRRPY